MKVEKGFIVRMDYEVRIKDGDVIESSSNAGAIEYEHGTGKMLPGLEKKLEGQSAGHEIKGEIAAVDVLGPEDGFPTSPLLKANFPKDVEMKVGATFEAKTPKGDPMLLKVVDVGADSATMRLLPVIFGKDLTFRAKILMIQDPKSGQKVVVDRKPPPPPAAALKVDIVEEKESK
jgi:FKBP-type peptidyl-prolyl cis-trans isomerase SlyD